MGWAAVSLAGDETGAPEADETMALKVLRLDWGSTWRIGRGDGRWRAARRDGTGLVLTRASADGLAMALRISQSRP